MNPLRSVLWTMLIAASAAAPRPADRCGQAFTGFDSRLHVDLVGILPEGAGAPVGFGLAAGGPIVATADHVYALTSAGTIAIPVDRPIIAIATDDTGRIALQSADGVAFVGRTGLEPIARWGRIVEGRIFGSGEHTFVEAIEKDSVTSVGVRQPRDGRVLPVLQLTGSLHAVSWDRHGLLAVIGRSLVRWAPPGNALERIAADAGFDSASGACALDAGRAIVSTRTATLLFAATRATVIAGAGGWCRTSGDAIFLFDPRVRRVWKLTGTADLGAADLDLARAARLVQLAVAQDPPVAGTLEFREAVRLIGCSQAIDIAERLQK